MFEMKFHLCSTWLQMSSNKSVENPSNVLCFLHPRPQASYDIISHYNMSLSCKKKKS